TRTPRTAPRSSSPPGQARRAAARSRQLQLTLVVTLERGWPLDAPEQDPMARAAPRFGSGCLRRDRAAHAGPRERLGEDGARTARRLEARLAETREARRRRAEPDRRHAAARSANFAYRFWKASFSMPVAPFRCLARINSAIPA